MNAIDKTTALDDDALNAMIDARLEAMLETKLESKLSEIKDNRTPSLSIISTKGTLDMAYPPFILSSTAAALGWDVNVFFTFYGLDLLKKEIDLKISPLGNPAMPMKMPFGPEWFKGIEWNMPNAFTSNIPGFEGMASNMMKKTMNDKGVASIDDLREATIEAGADLYACQMTVDLFGHKPEDYIDEVAGWIGAASFLTMAKDADVQLFV